MKVLVACEESQEVCKAFRNLGHEAYSCDIIDCSGGHPEWHVKGDALLLINGDVQFTTCDGTVHEIQGKWDILIAHPPCTYLTTAATRHLSLKCTPPEKVVDRLWKVAKAAVFFMQFALANCEKICVENPMGYMSRLWRRPNQVIHPYYFAESINDTRNYHKKRTCLWLKNLEPLKPTNNLPPPKPLRYGSNGKAVYFTENGGKIDGLERDCDRSKTRSKTFSGVARAMAEQWGGNINV